MKLSKELERARKKVVLALDVDTLDKAKDLVSRLHPFVGMFKVGLELITAEGVPKVVNAIKEMGGEVFLDGKFDDIPNTVGGASKQAIQHGVKIFNLHASASMPAMLEAVKNKGQSKVYAVTVLTSIDEHNCNIVFGGPTKAKVLQMAREAKLAGCDGIICSPQELEMLKGCPELSSLKKMTPGIRPFFSQVNDQKRVMTPAEAIKAGASYLVIGRPITKPDNMTPEKAALKVLEEIAPVLEDEALAREKEIEKIFEETQAIITGSHVVYTSGRHGEAYINKDAIYPYTSKVSRLCQFIAEDFEDEEIDVVVGPVVGGVALAQWTAHHLSLLQGKEVLAVCADKDGDLFVIKRGQGKFIKDRKVLIVEDVLTTGGSVKKVIEAIREIGGQIVGVAALCNRGNVTAEDLGNVPTLKALADADLQDYAPEDCPLCKEERPINTAVGKGLDYLKQRAAKE